MKTTLVMRNTANPRRTTLIQLQDGHGELAGPAELAVEPAELDAMDSLSAEGLLEQTANPAAHGAGRRTRLTFSPQPA